MNKSILVSTKSTLGLAADYTPFDGEILMHLNAAVAKLTQLGVGPKEGFLVDDEVDTWEDFMGDEPRLNMVPSYAHYSVKLAFDPPQTGFAMSAMKEQLDELAFRITVVMDEINAEIAAAAAALVVEEEV